MLTSTGCKIRQGRLLQIMDAQKLDAVCVGSAWHVYYLTGFWPRWVHHAGAIVFSDGRVSLVAAEGTRASSAASKASPIADGALNLAVDHIIEFEPAWMSTLRQEQPSTVAKLLSAKLQNHHCTTIATDTSAVTDALRDEISASKLSLTGGRLSPAAETGRIDADLWQLRRRKESDELALMKMAIFACEEMYEKARQIIEPGIAELDVFAELHRTAILTTGEPMTAFLGNDYACGVPGGNARNNRRAQAGELYILDLGPTYRGYFADNARAISVDRKPTDAQYQAWSHIVHALKIVESMAKPSVRCRDIFAAVDEHFKQTRNTGMPHHLGHGVGLQPHEYPHLNPNWDDVLEEGDIFTAEPGQYSPGLAGGIRLENQYRVTATGVECLVNSSLELV